MVDSSCAGDLPGLSVCGPRRRCIGGGATALRGCRLRRRVEDAGAPAACRRGHSRHSRRRAAAAAVPGCPRAARGCGGRNDRHRAGGSPLRAGCVDSTAPRARCVQGREGPAPAGDCQSRSTSRRGRRSKVQTTRTQARDSHACSRSWSDPKGRAQTRCCGMSPCWPPASRRSATRRVRRRLRLLRPRPRWRPRRQRQCRPASMTRRTRGSPSPRSCGRTCRSGLGALVLRQIAMRCSQS